MVNEFHQFIISQELIQKNDNVLLAISGGKDSMCLADLFRNLPYNIGIAHLNHGVRDLESDLDEALVADYAKIHDISFYKKKVDLRNVSSNFQSIARKKRMQWLQEIAAEFDYQKIATAHHLDDQVENFFIRLNRNSGLKGLKGMIPISGMFIKPLLFTYRKNIDTYVEQHNIPFREDQSNFSDKYDRNFIRNKIIPIIETCYPDFSKNVIKALEKMGEANLAIEDFSLQIEKTITSQKKNRTHIDLEQLLDYPHPSLILFYILNRHGLNRTQSDNLFEAKTGALIQSERLIFLKDRNKIILKKREITKKAITIKLEKNNSINLGEYGFLKTTNQAKIDNEKNKNKILIDEGSIQWPLIVRNRKSGDFFYPKGMNMKKKKLKKYLIDQKLNMFEKEKVLVLTDSLDKIIWVIGYRQDERFFPNSTTKNITTIELDKNEL